MDLIYMTDVLAYQSIRGPVYDKYNWEQQEKNNLTRKEINQKKNKEKEPCKICQERQRRSLMKYIRSKSHEHSEHDIKEEEEEEAVTEATAVQRTETQKEETKQEETQR